MLAMQRQLQLPPTPGSTVPHEKLPSSQKFWELLLGGEDMIIAFAGENGAKEPVVREVAQPAEFRKSNASQDIQDEVTPSGPTVPSHESPIKGAVDAGIDFMLHMSGDELYKQPAVLHMEAEKLANAQDELAVQNCSLFLASSKALHSLSCSVERLSGTLADVEKRIQPLYVGLKQYGTESNTASSCGASLRTLVFMQRIVSGLLEFPMLVSKCTDGGLYDEAVDALMLADERIAALRANGCCNTRLLDSLEAQMKDARNSCVKALLRQLGEHAQLAASMKLIGPLRRLSCSEEQLRAQFLHKRDGQIARERHKAEKACETEPSHGLCTAAELLRLDVLQTAVHYRAIFSATSGPLSAWLADQVHWFVTLVNQELGIDSHRTRIAEGVKEETALLDLASVEALVGQMNMQSTPEFRVKLQDLATVFRQAYNAACTLRRVHCYFFPAVALTFDRYIVSLHRHTIERIAVAFYHSMDKYDYAPSMLYASFLEGSPCFEGSLFSADPSCVFLLRHPPLSNLYNSISEVLNSFQECPISTAAGGLGSLLEGLLLFCIRKLISLKPGKRKDYEAEVIRIERTLTRTREDREIDVADWQAEFFVFCDVFHAVLLPTLSGHMAKIIPSPRAPSLKKLRAMMEQAGLSEGTNPLTMGWADGKGPRNTSDGALESSPPPSEGFHPVEPRNGKYC